MNRFLVFFLLACFCQIGFAQRNCGTSHYDSLKISKREYIKARKAFEDELLKTISQRKSSRIHLSDSIVTIPLAVHVVYHINKPEQNISLCQILSQITALNEDYRKKPGTPGFNTSPIGADIRIEFCLATIDPAGQPTTGITLHATTSDGFDISLDDEKLKSYGYWPSDQYLNIWVAELSGFLGYTQFPDHTGLPGLETSYNTALTDGVAIGYKYFGRKTGTVVSPKFNLGRTLTHEVGHWLGLKHTWGDENDCGGTDYCDDTPSCNGQYFASYASCPEPVQCGSTSRQIQNYLDYSDDFCMNMFTLDQKTRMRTTLDVSPRRKALKNSLGCSGASILPIDPESLVIPTVFTPNGDGKNEQFKIDVGNGCDRKISLLVMNRLGTLVYSSADYDNDWNGTNLPDGIYFYSIKDAGRSYKGWLELIR